MIIETLRVKGIGPYKNEVVLHPSTLDEIIAVTGRNGLGKTFLLETIPGALYGYFPFRMFKQQGVSIYDFVAENQESFIELIVLVGKRRFRIIRNFNLEGTWVGDAFQAKTQDQTAIIYEEVAGEWTPRADKQRAVLDYVEENICLKQVFLSAMFNAQNSAGDLVSCTADERKQIFASIIGLDGLQEKSDLFSKRVKQVTGLVEKLKVLIQAEQANIVDVSGVQEQIKTMEAEIQASENKLHEIELNKENMIIAREQQTARLKERNELGKKLAVALEERDRIRLEIKDCLDKAAVLPAIQGKINELTGLKADYKALQTEVEAANLVASELSEKEKRTESLRLALVKAGQGLKDSFTEVEKTISTIKDKIYKDRVQLTEWERKTQGAAVLDKLKCAADCDYVAGARADKEWLSSMAGERERLETEIAGLEADLQTGNLKAQELRKRLEDKDYAHEERTEGKALLEEIASLKVNLAAYSDVQAKARKLSARIEILEGERLHERLSTCEVAMAKREELEKQIPALDATIQEQEKFRDDFKALDYDEIIQRNNKEIEDIRQGIKQYTQAIERDKARIMTSKRSALKVSVIESKKKSLEAVCAGYSQLSEAFSRSGIQALIIDAEKSTFLNIARELFSILSGGALELNFTTMKENKGDKKKKETFDLRLKVDGKERKLEQASQGQQDLARIVMRGTLGIYFSMKTGSRMESYFLDETTGSLDELNREAYYDFLKYLLKFFRQIFVITHQDIAKQIPCHVNVNENRELEIA